MITYIIQEVPNNSCTDGSFGKYRPFVCHQKKGFYVYLSKVKKDSRFQENPEFCDRNMSQGKVNYLKTTDVRSKLTLLYKPVIGYYFAFLNLIAVIKYIIDMSTDGLVVVLVFICCFKNISYFVLASFGKTVFD